MKPLLLVLLPMLAVTSSISAQNLIAVQNGGIPVFYTKLDSAIIHAKDGDTLYLPGGYISSSGKIIIDKILHLVGVGFHPDSNNVTGNTIIQASIEILAGVQSGSITGIYDKNYNLTIHDSVSNINISRCYFNSIQLNAVSSIPVTDVTIAETIADYGISANCTTSNCPKEIRFFNCYIGNTGTRGFPAISANMVYWSNIKCKNCILYGWSYMDPWPVALLNFIRNSSFENCIFMDPNTFTMYNSTNNTFRNCIFNHVSNIYNGFPDNLIYNCFYDQSVEQTFINAPGNWFNLKNNYHLMSTSLGKNAGTDGLDIGLYGGPFPWKDSSIPFNPHFQQFQVAPKTDNQGNLNVNIKVKAQDH